MTGRTCGTRSIWPNPRYPLDDWPDPQSPLDDWSDLRYPLDDWPDPQSPLDYWPDRRYPLDDWPDLRYPLDPLEHPGGAGAGTPTTPGRVGIGGRRKVRWKPLRS